MMSVGIWNTGRKQILQQGVKGGAERQTGIESPSGVCASDCVKTASVKSFPDN